MRAQFTTIVLTAAAAAAAASPTTVFAAAAAASPLPSVTAGAPCLNASTCSWFWDGGKCAAHCRRHGGLGYECVAFVGVDTCGSVGRKRCCCSR
jgi:hypothetical protein